MNPLYLFFQGVNQVSLNVESESLTQGCKYAPGNNLTPGPFPQGNGSVAAETVDEVIEIALAGDWAGISLRVKLLETLFYLAESQPLKKDWVYLRFFDGGGYDWRSRIVAGRVELGARGLADRDQESQVIKLYITRLNYWAAPKKEVPGFTRDEQEPDFVFPVAGIGGMEDADHVNGFGMCGHAMEGDLPGPVEMRIENNTSSDPFGDFTISQRVIPGTNRTDAGFVQGEDLLASGDTVKTVVSDPFCSAAYYATFAWTGTDEKDLAIWIPTPAELMILAGAAHRPILRLRDWLTDADVWASVKVNIHNAPVVIAESLWTLIPVNTKYVELAPINIPPLLQGSATFGAVDVVLYVWRAGGGGTLGIDFIQFTPAERVRRLKTLYQGMAIGHNRFLVDSGIEEETYYLSYDGFKETTHIGTGRYLEVVPGCDSMVRVLHRAHGDATFDIFTELDYHLWYEPRRRTL